MDVETDLGSRIAETPAVDLADLEAQLIVASHLDRLREFDGQLTTAGDAIESALLSIRYMINEGEAEQ